MLIKILLRMNVVQMSRYLKISVCSLSLFIGSQASFWLRMIRCPILANYPTLWIMLSHFL